MFFLSERNQFKILMFLVSFIGTFFAWVYPWINAFALMCFGIPTFIFLFAELRR